MSEQMLAALAELCCYNEKKEFSPIDLLNTKEELSDWLDKYHPLVNEGDEQDELWEIISKKEPISKFIQNELFDFQGGAE
jgi:hypothetical protein